MTEFLGALVRALRPDRVLETGAYHGHTTEVLGRAVQPYGHVDALEIDPECAEIARQRCAGLPVTVHCVDSAEFDGDYDFVFFDSGMDARIEELKRFAHPGRMFAIHDSRGYWIQMALKSMNVQRVDLPTPRGITIGRYL